MENGVAIIRLEPARRFLDDLCNVHLSVWAIQERLQFWYKKYKYFSVENLSRGRSRSETKGKKERGRRCSRTWMYKCACLNTNKKMRLFYVHKYFSLDQFWIFRCNDVIWLPSKYFAIVLFSVFTISNFVKNDTVTPAASLLGVEKMARIAVANAAINALFIVLHIACGISS